MQPFSLRKAILREILRQKVLEGEREFSDRIFHASEAGDCARVMYLRRMPVKPDPRFASRSEEARISMLLNDGRRHQESVSIPMRSSRELELTNVEQMKVIPIEDAIIVGHPDGIVHYKGKRYVIEIKGLTTWNGVWKREPTIQSLKDGYPTAIAQARLYSRMWFTDGAFILLKNKDNAKLLEFFLPRNIKLEDKLIQKYTDVRRAIDAGRKPRCGFTKLDWQCKYCPYPEECSK